MGGDAKIEDWLDSKGVSWEFYPRLETDQFDAEQSLHDQARFEPIDEKRVESYVEAMRRGDQFPPVLAHGRMGKLILADGNQPPPLSGLGNSVSEAPGGRLQPAAPLPLSAPRSPLTPLPPPCPWKVSQQAAAGFLGGYRGTTRAAYTSDVRDLFGFAAAVGRPVLLLTRSDLDAYIGHLLDERRLAVSTVRRRLAVTNQMFVWAVEEGLLVKNPASRMRRPRAQLAPPRVRLSVAQMRVLLAAAEADGLRSAVLVHLLMLHGCRIGEVLGSDVDDLHGPDRGRRLRLLAKGGIVREVMLTVRTAALVGRLVEDQGDGPLLRSGTGGRWHRTNAARHLRRLAADVLDREIAATLHPHALRRSFVDAGLAAGATLGELQFALGHRSSAMVLVYAAQQIPGNDAVPVRVARALRDVDAVRSDAAGADDLHREARVVRVEGDEGVRHQPPVEAVDHQVDLGLGVALGLGERAFDGTGIL